MDFISARFTYREKKKDYKCTISRIGNVQRFSCPHPKGKTFSTSTISTKKS